MELLSGFASAFQYLLYHPFNWLLLIFGTVWGILFGAIPGLTGIVGVALLIPFTFTLGPIEGLLMLGAVYCGSTFGGSISAILFNTPGAPEAACTTLDGYPMAKQGFAGKAIGYALGASAFGGLFGTVVLILMAPPLAEFALEFGPPEYFALAVLGITAIASIGTKSVFKSLLSGMIGLGLATVGMDPLTSFANSISAAENSPVGHQLCHSGHHRSVRHGGGPQAVGRDTKGADPRHRGKVRTELPTLKEMWKLKVALIRSSSSARSSVCCPGWARRRPRSSGIPRRFGGRSIQSVSGRALPRGLYLRSRRTTAPSAGRWCPCSRWASREALPRR